MITILIVFVAIDIIGVFRRQGIFSTDHMSHLGGYAAGIMASESMKYKVGLRQNRRGKGENESLDGRS